MKKTILLPVLILLTFLSHAQEISTSPVSEKLFFILKTKLGISQLEFLNNPPLNGNITQIDVLLSSRISNAYRLEYGLGFSQFNGNNLYNNQYVDVKNNNFRLPVNLMYNRDFDKNASLVYGLGVYGTHFGNTGVKGYYEGVNVGLTIGASVQLGANFKISDNMSFRILAEIQRDLTKISKSETIEIRERMNALLGLNFVYRL